MSDVIDPYNRAEQYARRKAHIAEDASLHPENRRIILQYLRDCELGKTIRKGQKKKIGPARNLRVTCWLYLLDRWFRKPFPKITTREMEDFILKLEAGQIKSNREKPYTSESQISLKKFIRKFWKWMKGDNKSYPDEAEWIDTSGAPPEISAIPELRKGVKKLAAYAPTHQTKAIVWVLFDSGARLTEFLNIRIGDLERGEGQNRNLFFVRIRQAASKTKGRTVSLPIASEALTVCFDSNQAATSGANATPASTRITTTTISFRSLILISCSPPFLFSYNLAEALFLTSL